MLATGLAVELTEGRRHVHQAGAFLGGDVPCGDDAPPVGSVRGRQVVEGPLIVQAQERCARKPGGDAVPRAHSQHVVDELLGDHRLVHHGVDQLGIHGHAGVGQERPGCRRPHGEPPRRTDEVRVGVEQTESDVGRLVLLVAVDVGLAQFVARQRGATTRAVRHHLEVLVEQSPVEHRLQVPPDRLDVVGAQRPVGRIHVDPVADARGQSGEFVDVGVDGLPAEPGELGDADLLLYLLLPRDPELLFDLDLDRQPMRVPAGPAGHVGAVHGAEAAEQVLVDAGPHMVQAGHAVGRGGPFVEDPGRSPLALLDGPFEDAVPRPAGQFGLLECDEVDVGGDGCEHGGGMVGTGERRSPVRRKG